MLVTVYVVTFIQRYIMTNTITSVRQYSPLTNSMYINRYNSFCSYFSWNKTWKMWEVWTSLNLNWIWTMVQVQGSAKLPNRTVSSVRVWKKPALNRTELNLSITITNHPWKRVRMFVFKGGAIVVLKNNPPPSKTSTRTRFRGWWDVGNDLEVVN